MSGKPVHAALLFAAVLTILFVPIDAASAFYWRNWPGSGTGDPSSGSGSQPPSTSGSGSPVPPIVTTTGGTAPPTGGSGTTDPIVSTTGSQVPEPASLVIGLIGLGALGLSRKLRKK
jgi:hypothetical protein